MALRSIRFFTKIVGGAAFGALLAMPAAAAEDTAGIPGVVAPGVEPQLVGAMFDNTEGPLGAADGSLYFSDTNASRTYHLANDGKITIFREGTDRGNGIAYTRDGDMLWAHETGILEIGKNRRINRTQGFRVFQPNDLIADDKGGIYFTDPGPRPVVKGLKVNVYYLPKGSRQPIVVDDSVTRPNGVALSNNGRILYVADTVGTVEFAYDVQPDGSLKNKRPFAGLHDIKPGQEGFGDGIAVDREDRLYVSSLTGIQVFDRGGKYLGTIEVPRQPSNMAFAGPDKKVLYITARKALYRLQMLSQGPERLGK
jgi:gluconolactonase